MSVDTIAIIGTIFWVLAFIYVLIGRLTVFSGFNFLNNRIFQIILFPFATIIIAGVFILLGLVGIIVLAPLKFFGFNIISFLLAQFAEFFV